MTLPDLTAADLVHPDWHAPSRVRAFITTRNGGVSEPPFGQWHDGRDAAGGLNLGRLAGDDPQAVEINRARVLRHAGVEAAAWLQQVHGAQIVVAEEVIAGARRGEAPVRADASVTGQPGIACVVMIADCMPVLFCDDAGKAVGAAHAGWRGLAAGIVEATAQKVAALAGVDVSTLHAYLGPSIGPSTFEVGPDVRDAFVDAAASYDDAARDATARAFVTHPRNAGKYLADLPALARTRLARLGVMRVQGGSDCTVTDRERFFSYRRDRETGRMAAFIWIAE